MSFKETILKKIKIDQMANKVIGSIGPVGSEKKADLETMRNLLEMGEYTTRKERDLELYFLDRHPENKQRILVLDNELAIYHTHIEDVAMRKSPTVKEMLNIRNAMRILNDKDVVVSKRDVSVNTIRNECIARLDLKFDVSDIEAIAADGKVALEKSYSDAVLETLTIFKELLGFEWAPKPFKVSNSHIMGQLSKGIRGEPVMASIVIYGLIYDALKWVDASISANDKEQVEWLQLVAMNREKAHLEGPEVFDHLASEVLKKKAAGRLPEPYR